ncbi:O-antigen ligase family protein [Diaphorobacter aerolatus]|uniref:O-antigen ligase family protein n=1 Tax=Diaphorobacter aerolatus TaxID=1288495 RepID=A0A7H0GQF3_9BURK|nr:O-antigen ligase family protein [Diaphorobacter aerolatus]
MNSAAAFAVPGLALWLASGYSYGAALLLIGALLTLKRWPVAPQRPLTYWFAVCLFSMALIWIAMADPSERLGQWDRPSKFILAIPCLLYATVYPPRPRAFIWGLIAGCIGAGAIAIWQVHVLGEWRATGRTNAIQYGNLALLLSVLLTVFLAAIHKQLNWSEKVLATVAIVAGLDASVLSASRGGWLAVLVAMPFGLVLLYRYRVRLFWRVVVGLMVAAGLMSVINREMLTVRWDEMASEIRVYDTQRNANTSVGQRLEHWRFALEAGKEKPLLGWGVAGYTQEKARRVALGQYQPAIVIYKFVHNEILDVFVKTGLVGVALLMWFYILPLRMFWPTRERMRLLDAGINPPLRRMVLAVRMCGVCVPVLYFGFGLTQVFFAHNSGIMFYLFSIILLWSMLIGLERTVCDAAAAKS